MFSSQNLISKLKELKLSLYPIVEIKNIMEELETFRIMQIVLRKGKIIFRARLNAPNEIFKTVSELSYKPAKLNKSYQRASTPNATMFYGCSFPENTLNDEIEDIRTTLSQEAGNLLRKGIENGEERITFCKWIITKDLPLVAIVYHKDFINNYAHTKKLYTVFQSLLKKFPQDVEDSNIITEYIASEFAKNEISHDYDYLISALFTEMILEKGLAGVYYPSVRDEGKGFNVAIHPDFVERNMIPIAAGECSLYKMGGFIIPDYDTYCELPNGQKEFIFKPVDHQFHMGREFCYQILNGKNHNRHLNI